MEPDVKQRVQAQFGAAAERYVASAGHAKGDDLAQLVALAGLRGHERVLDVATGGGHTALAFAPHASEVVASDLTPDMLAAAERFVRGQGAQNVRFELADAEALPFADAGFDVVTVRIAPHHFPDPARFVAEVARVLRPGGIFLLDDNVAPEDADLATFINRVDAWRDPSHVRCLPVSEWRALIEAAGLDVEHVSDVLVKSYDFAPWAERMAMPVAEQAALERWLLAAPEACVAAFQIVAEGGRVRSLSTGFVIIKARKLVR